MILRKKFKDLSLTSSSAICSKCGLQHNIPHPIDREGRSGTLCGHCGKYLWHESVRHIYLSSGNHTLSVEEAIAKTRKQETEYFSGMPDCPTCGHHAWEGFIESILAIKNYPPDCRNCGTKFGFGVFRDNTAQCWEEDAYWYEPNQTN